MVVICDWLDLTYSPDDRLPEGLTGALNESLFSVSFTSDDKGGTKTVWRSDNGGTVQIQENPRFIRVSTSGRALEHLRVGNQLEMFYVALSTEAHRVTRLDLALDLPVDTPIMLADYRKRFSRTCRLTRKAVKTRYLTETREDGLETGTFYVGAARSGTVTARVYDKQKEIFDRTGLIVPPTTRVEVTARSATCATLRDAALPESLFWHIAAPSLLSSPAKIKPWSPANPNDTGWKKDVREFVPYQVLRNRVENTPDLSALVELSLQLGLDGPEILKGMIDQRIDFESASRSSDIRGENQRVVGG